MAEQDFSGDYGYDLAHEIRSGAVGQPADRVRRVPLTGPRAMGRESGFDGDLGYDSAHEA